MPQYPSSSSSPRPQKPGPSLHRPGALRFATDRQPWQRSLRWAKPVRDRRLLVFGGLFALAITVLQLVGFALAMRSYRVHPRPSAPIQVVLIEPESSIPMPPEPEAPIVARPSRIAITPPELKTPPPPPRPAEDSEEMRARIGAAGSAASAAPAPQLFNPDGSIRLDSSAAPSAPAAPKNPQEAAKARWAQIEQRGNPIDCHKTRFAQAYKPDESVGDKVSRKYLKWVGLADMEAIEHRNTQRAEAGGCEPAK
jgi:hypothetical protein